MLDIAEKVLNKLQEKKKSMVTAESCTGGLIAAALTDIPGSSSGFDRGFVTYTNHSKSQILGVDPQTLERFGAVSSQVAAEMAQGALKNSEADIAVSVTGIAGPAGGSAEKPVGTIWFGLAQTGAKPKSEYYLFEGTRSRIREQSVEKALELILEELS